MIGCIVLDGTDDITLEAPKDSPDDQVLYTMFEAANFCKRYKIPGVILIYNGFVFDIEAEISLNDIVDKLDCYGNRKDK